MEGDRQFTDLALIRKYARNTDGTGDWWWNFDARFGGKIAGFVLNVWQAARTQMGVVVVGANGRSPLRLQFK